MLFNVIQDEVQQAEVMSRLYLMVGSRYDEESMLQRLQIDCNLNWTKLELKVAMVQAGLSRDSWACAYHYLVTSLGISTSVLQEFDTLRQVSPGEAGFFFGHQSPSLNVADLEQVWPAGGAQINAGFRLGQRLPHQGSLAEINRGLHRLRNFVRVSRILPARLLELTEAMEGSPVASQGSIVGQLAALQIRQLDVDGVPHQARNREGQPPLFQTK